MIMDGERNHSMANPMDGTPPQSEEQMEQCLLEYIKNALYNVA